MTTPPKTQYCTLAFPTPEILLVTLNRPKALNCINISGHWELDAVWNYLDNQPELRVGIITGEGRAFCAGADLKEWSASKAEGAAPRPPHPPSGFGALSRRSGKKPVIAAVNGLCFGGGMEMAINCDLIVASPRAVFGLPEVKRGVVAIAGALPRLVRTVGKQRAMEMALTGRTLTAEEGKVWGFVNRIAEDVVGEAVKLGKEISGNSPDSVVVSREGVKLGWEGVGAEEGSRLLVENWYPRLESGENMKEGLKAFVEKREPRWVPSKL